jgi:ABC-type enterochelin transport system permease subunit
MNGLNAVKGWIGSLTEIGLMLLALGIVLALLAGQQVPFLGNVAGNIVALVGDLGKNGVVGLIALGVILWLFSKRSMA